MAKIVRNRLYLPSNLAEADALWTRVSPYRLEDEAAIELMCERARRAREAGDRRWVGEAAPATPSENAVEANLAGWVAVVPSETGPDRVIGIADVVGAGLVPEMPTDMPLAGGWRHRIDVALVTRLSVEPEFWRRQVGMCLTSSAINAYLRVQERSGHVNIE